MSPTAPFNFTRAMSLLCADIVTRLDELQHIRMEHIAIGFAQTRQRSPHGLQAKLTPMRFEAGALTTVRYSQTWTVQRLFQGDHEILYLLTFYLPRFLNQPFRQKLVTVLHELYHISPRFDGDIRRLEGRYHVHTHNQKDYDRSMESHVDRYLALDPPEELLAFLKHRFDALRSRYGEIVGVRIPAPRLIRVNNAKSA
jgi:predicted metallopeptidase